MAINLKASGCWIAKFCCVKPNWRRALCDRQIKRKEAEQNKQARTKHQHQKRDLYGNWKYFKAGVLKEGTKAQTKFKDFAKSIRLPFRK